MRSQTAIVAVLLAVGVCGLAVGGTIATEPLTAEIDIGDPTVGAETNHTVKKVISNDTVGNSLDHVEVDYSEGEVPELPTNTDSVVRAGLDTNDSGEIDVDATDDLKSVEVENGEKIVFHFGGSYSTTANPNDRVIIEYTDVVNPNETGPHKVNIQVNDDQNEWATTQYELFEPLNVENFTFETADRAADLRLNVSEDVDTIEVDINGNRDVTLGKDDFTQTGTGEYLAENINEGDAGTYDATLEEASREDDGYIRDAAGGESTVTTLRPLEISDSNTSDNTTRVGETMVDQQFTADVKGVTNADDHEFVFSFPEGFEGDIDNSVIRVDGEPASTTTLDETNNTVTATFGIDEGDDFNNVTITLEADITYPNQESVHVEGEITDGSDASQDSASIATVEVQSPDAVRIIEGNITNATVEPAETVNHSLAVSLEDLSRNDEAAAFTVRVPDIVASTATVTDVRATNDDVTVEEGSPALNGSAVTVNLDTGESTDTVNTDVIVEFEDATYDSDLRGETLLFDAEVQDNGDGTSDEQRPVATVEVANRDTVTIVDGEVDPAQVETGTTVTGQTVSIDIEHLLRDGESADVVVDFPAELTDAFTPTGVSAAGGTVLDNETVGGKQVEADLDVGDGGGTTNANLTVTFDAEYPSETTDTEFAFNASVVDSDGNNDDSHPVTTVGVQQPDNVTITNGTITNATVAPAETVNHNLTASIEDLSRNDEAATFTVDVPDGVAATATVANISATNNGVTIEESGPSLDGGNITVSLDTGDHTDTVDTDVIVEFENVTYDSNTRGESRAFDVEIQDHGDGTSDEQRPVATVKVVDSDTVTIVNGESTPAQISPGSSVTAQNITVDIEHLVRDGESADVTIGFPSELSNTFTITDVSADGGTILDNETVAGERVEADLDVGDGGGTTNATLTLTFDADYPADVSDTELPFDVDVVDSDGNNDQSEPAATVAVQPANDVQITGGNVTNTTVEPAETVSHNLTVSIENLSQNGETATFTVDVPDEVAAEASVDGVWATSDGVTVEDGDPSLNGSNITVGLDAGADTGTVETDVVIEFEDVRYQSDTRGETFAFDVEVQDNGDGTSDEQRPVETVEVADRNTVTIIDGKVIPSEVTSGETTTRQTVSVDIDHLIRDGEEANVTVEFPSELTNEFLVREVAVDGGTALDNETVNGEQVEIDLDVGDGGGTTDAKLTLSFDANYPAETNDVALQFDAYVEDSDGSNDASIPVTTVDVQSPESVVITDGTITNAIVEPAETTSHDLTVSLGDLSRNDESATFTVEVPDEIASTASLSEIRATNDDVTIEEDDPSLDGGEVSVSLDTGEGTDTVNTDVIAEFEGATYDSDMRGETFTFGAEVQDHGDGTSDEQGSVATVEVANPDRVTIADSSVDPAQVEAGATVTGQTVTIDIEHLLRNGEAADVVVNFPDELTDAFTVTDVSADGGTVLNHDTVSDKQVEAGLDVGDGGGTTNADLTVTFDAEYPSEGTDTELAFNASIVDSNGNGDDSHPVTTVDSNPPDNVTITNGTITNATVAPAETVNHNLTVSIENLSRNGEPANVSVIFPEELTDSFTVTEVTSDNGPVLNNETANGRRVQVDLDVGEGGGTADTNLTLTFTADYPTEVADTELPFGGRVVDSDGNTNNETVTTVDLKERPNGIANFTLDAVGNDELNVTVDSLTQLDEFTVEISGPESKILDENDFNQEAVDSEYQYTTGIAVDDDGTYEATLREATDVYNGTLTDGQSDTATISSSPSGPSGGTGGTTDSSPVETEDKCEPEAETEQIQEDPVLHRTSVCAESGVKLTANHTQSDVRNTGITVDRYEFVSETDTNFTFDISLKETTDDDLAHTTRITVGNDTSLDDELRNGTLVVEVPATAVGDAPANEVQFYDNGEPVDHTVLNETEDVYQFAVPTESSVNYVVGVPDGEVVVVDTALVNNDVSVGETAKTEAVLKNNGYRYSNTTVTMRVDGVVVDERAVTLEGNNRTTVTFAWEASNPGEFDVTVGEMDTGKLTVISERGIETTETESVSPSLWSLLLLLLVLLLPAVARRIRDEE